MTDLELTILAGHLGNRLGLAPDHTWSGRGLRLGVEGDGLYIERASPTHIEVYGWFPAEMPSWGVPGRPKPVRCAMDRGPAVIGRDIARRYLAPYRAYMARARDQLAREQAQRAARDKLATLIWGLFPPDKVHAFSQGRDTGMTQLTVYLAGHHGGHVDVSHDGGQVTLDRFTVPPHVALVMLEAAAQMTRPAE